MAEIIVRPIRFSFQDVPVDLEVDDETLGRQLPLLALSLTMPYLEPYLIRTMKAALREIGDPVLAEDVRRFSQQEGHHFRNHADFNERIREAFGPAAGAALRAIEDALESDYQRFTRRRSLRFNAVYAEGFEALTCAAALASAEHRGFEGVPGGEIWAWHMAEEIEHRTVAFRVYEHVVGSYPYRLVVGGWAQWHYLSYIGRFARCMARALGRRPPNPRSPMHRAALRNYLRTWSPRYDPARIPLPDGVAVLLEHYTAVATSR